MWKQKKNEDEGKKPGEPKVAKPAEPAAEGLITPATPLVAPSQSSLWPSSSPAVSHGRELDDEESVYGGYGGYSYKGHGGYSGVSSFVETAQSLGKDLKSNYYTTYRKNAAEKLGKMGTDEALNELISSLKEEKDTGVAQAIVDAVCAIGKKGSVKELLSAAGASADNIGSIVAVITGEDQKKAIMAFGALRMDEALKYNVRRKVVSNQDAISRLWKSGSPAFQFLEELAQRDVDIETPLKKDPSLIDSALSATSKLIRRMGCRAAGKTGDPKYLPELIDALIADDDPTEAESAIIRIEKKLGGKGRKKS